MSSTEIFSSLVENIYEAGLDPQRWPGVLGHLAAACGANVVDLKLTHLARHRFTMVSVGMDPQAIEAYQGYYGRLDPILPAVERKPAGTLVVDRDVVPKPQLTSTEFYNDWARPQDVHDCAVLTAFRDQTRAGVICFGAPERAEAFDAPTLQLLRRLIPHIDRAMRITLKMADLDAFRSAGLEALDCLNDGVVLADANARVIFANRAAEAILAGADGIAVEPSGLCAANSAQTQALRRLIALSARRENAAEAGGSLSLERPSGRRPLSVTVAPMHRDMIWRPLASPIAIVFVADPEQESELPQSRLRALYGMTRAEAAVARLIARGSGVKIAARMMGIAPSTVRTHLDRIFDKTGTSRQAELAHLVNRLTPLPGARQE